MSRRTQVKRAVVLCPQWVEAAQVSVLPKTVARCVSPGGSGAPLLSSRRAFQALRSSLALPQAGLRILLRLWALHLSQGQHFTDCNCRYTGQGPVGFAWLTQILAFLPFPSFLSFSTAADHGSGSFSRTVSSVCHLVLISCGDITVALLEQFKKDLAKWNNLH